MRASRLCEFVLLIAVVIGLGAPAGAAAVRDPLARPEFDGDITLSMRGESVLRVYDALASFAHVPFILAFDEDDPRLKVSFKAENMGVRAILSSLAKTYGLEYSTADTAILVTRKGQPATEKRKTVGPWQAPVPHYRLDLSIRSQDGRVLSTPYVTTGLKQEVTMKQGLQVFPPRGAIGDSIMEVELVPQKETAGGLELGVKWSLHEGATKTAGGSGETLLFTTPHGFQVFLQSWSRRPAEAEGTAQP
jgi:hypothetical protein